MASVKWVIPGKKPGAALGFGSGESRARVAAAFREGFVRACRRGCRRLVVVSAAVAVVELPIGSGCAQRKLSRRALGWKFTRADTDE